jgi:GT2 family glycosyltransferase
MTDHPSPRRRRSRTNQYRQLIHLLNQRYHEQWERAEGLEIQLARVQNRWWGPLYLWLRACKRWLRPARYTGRPASTPGELASVPCRFLDEVAGRVSGLVSIIIPFKDRLELLRGCLRSLRRSTYRQREILLVDNGSTRPATQRFLERVDGRGMLSVLSCPGPFNFSRLCNQGARAATGDYLLFLNNDTEVLTADWVERMLRVAVLPEVGVVGATLLYPDGTLQHAGLYPRPGGVWIHGYRGLPLEAPGDQGELPFIRTVPAVTGACLLIRRSLFESVGGFDEGFPLTYNDVDLCRRVSELGKQVVVTPHARLLHYEALSRGFSGD